VFENIHNFKRKEVCMKKFPYILTIVFFLFFHCLTATAAEKPSCEDLTEIADDLDEISAAFAKVETIREGDETDRALGEIIDALILIAETENEKALSDSVSSLTDAYNKMDSEKFGLSIDSVTANLDRLYRRDCQ
jgi:uncharacterized Zn finger protein